jgi:hypothetical protein
MDKMEEPKIMIDRDRHNRLLPNGRFFLPNGAIRIYNYIHIN